MTAAHTAERAAVRGRRTARPSGDERQLAILATAERLLEDRTLGEISIDDLARGAGISRPTFYFYFASKDAVLLTLLDRVVREAARATAELAGRLADDPPARLREAISRTYESFRSHRAVVLACARERGSNAEVRRLWDGVMEGWVQCTAALVEAERARGAAPGGLPARDLAVALNAMNERVLYATFSGEGPLIAGDRVVEVLFELWIAGVYGPGDPRPGRDSGA